MSAYSLPLHQSRWQRYLLLIMLLMVFVLFAAVPLSLIWLGIALPLLLAFFWCSSKAWSAVAIASSIHIAADGRLSWLQSNLPDGILCRGGLVADYVALLCWRSEEGKRHWQWLLADQFSPSDYRALARCIQQANWQ